MHIITLYAEEAESSKFFPVKVPANQQSYERKHEPSMDKVLGAGVGGIFIELFGSFLIY